MTIIGLTGRSGSGKSEAEKVIKAHFACWILDLDKIGHEVIKTSFVKESLVKAFGETILSDHEINRKILGDIVFSNPDQLTKLNSLVHPFIKKRVEEFIQKHKEQDGIISGALLEEIGLLPFCQSVITIDSEDQDILRVSPRQYHISQQQKSREHYRLIANEVVLNTYTTRFFDTLRVALKKNFRT